MWNDSVQYLSVFLTVINKSLTNHNPVREIGRYLESVDDVRKLQLTKNIDELSYCGTLFNT